jgi:hypothetical protein
MKVETEYPVHLPRSSSLTSRPAEHTHLNDPRVSFALSTPQSFALWIFILALRQYMIVNTALKRYCLILVPLIGKNEPPLVTPGTCFRRHARLF